ncbi:MAG TPA: hypothetical protein VFR42_00335, partial [Candidatus Acidoferrum sp.]|nr:hypothetical protein [Candidatus Acidoferrum sp.]
SGTGLVDQYGRAISSGIEEPLAAADPVVRKVSGSIREVGVAAEGTVPKMAAASAAIRTGFGEQSIRAVERFVSMIPGVGVALQAIFPVVGALALVEMLGKVFEKSEKVTEAEKAMADATKQAHDAFTTMAQTIDRLAAKDIGRAFGPAAGAAAEIRAMELQKDDLYKDLQKAKDQLGALATEAQGKILKRPTGGSLIEEEYKPKFEEAGKAIEAAQSKVTEFEARIKDARAQAAELAKTESGSLTAIEVSNAEKSAERRAEAVKSAALARIRSEHDVRQAVIDSEQDAGTREIATAEERVRLAQNTATAEITYEQSVTKAKVDGINARAAAESRGKPRSEVDKINATAGGEVAAAKDEGLQKGLDAQRAVDAEESKIGIAHAAAERGWAAETTRAWEEAGRKREEAAKKAAEEDNREAELAAKRASAVSRVSEFQAKSKGDLAALATKQKEIALEGEYDAKIAHSLSDEISYMRQIAELQHEQRAAEIAGVQAALDEAEAVSGELRDLRRIAELKAQIAKLTQEDKNASEEAANKAAKMAKDKSLAGQVASKLPQGSLEDKTTAAAADSIAQAVDGISSALGRSVVQGKNLGKALADAGKQLAMTTATQVLKAGLSSAVNALMQMIPAFHATAAAATASEAAQKAAAAAGVAAQKTLAEASVMTAAGEAAAWGFESVMAALPFPVNIAVAPAIAASALAQTEAYGQFAAGTDSAPGGMALVGEKGPELVNLPRGSQVIPNHKIMQYANGTPGYSSTTHYQSTSFQTGSTELHFHAHGMSNPDRFIDHVMRKIPEALKRRSSIFAPASR